MTLSSRPTHSIGAAAPGHSCSAKSIRESIANMRWACTFTSSTTTARRAQPEPSRQADFNSESRPDRSFSPEPWSLTCFSPLPPRSQSPSLNRAVEPAGDARPSWGSAADARPRRPQEAPGRPQTRRQAIGPKRGRPDAPKRPGANGAASVDDLACFDAGGRRMWERRRHDDAKCETLFATVGEGPLFVKNTEKVQGDDGDFAINCGPLIARATGVKRIGRCVRSMSPTRVTLTVPYPV
jgi:hypothetical protein